MNCIFSGNRHSFMKSNRAQPNGLESLNLEAGNRLRPHPS